MVNACLGVVFAVVLAAEAWKLDSGRRVWWFDCVVGTAVCSVCLMMRSRSRLWAALVALAIAVAAALTASLADLPGQPGPASMLAVLVLVAAAVHGLPWRQAAPVVLGAAALAALVARLHRDIGISVPGLWWVTAVAAGLLLRILGVQHQAALESVRRAERLALARELHDVAAHHITGVVLQAQAARIVARRRSAMLDDTLADIESAGTGALAAMRRVIGILRDGDAAGLAPGPEQLAQLVGRFAGPGAPVRLRLPDGPADPSWPPEVTTTVYRVVQEALTNIARHAPLARETTVTLAHDQRTVTVEVTDNAPAVHPRRFPSVGGYGIVGMRERVQTLGGTLTAGPCPGGGWSVRATLPLSNARSSGNAGSLSGPGPFIQTGSFHAEAGPPGGRTAAARP